MVRVGLGQKRTFVGECLDSLSIIVPDTIACRSVEIAEVGKRLW